MREQSSAPDQASRTRHTVHRRRRRRVVHNCRKVHHPTGHHLCIFHHCRIASFRLLLHCSTVRRRHRRKLAVLPWWRKGLVSFYNTREHNGIF
jgi:hypothetical protein